MKIKRISLPLLALLVGSGFHGSVYVDRADRAVLDRVHTACEVTAVPYSDGRIEPSQGIYVHGTYDSSGPSVFGDPEKARAKFYERYELQQSGFVAPVESLLSMGFSFVEVGYNGERLPKICFPAMVTEPGLYRFSLQSTGHPACERFEAHRELRWYSYYPEDQCIAVEKIDAPTAEYKLETKNDFFGSSDDVSAIRTVDTVEVISTGRKLVERTGFIASVGSHGDSIFT
jgi:hypothetical protein